MDTEHDAFAPILHRVRPTIVFDLDGTLVDTAPDLANALDHCLASDGLPSMPLEIVRPYAGFGSKVMLEKAYGVLGRELPLQHLAEQTERFLAHYEANIALLSRPFAGAIEALDRLADSGFTLAVCTNKYERLSRLLLQALDLSDRFAAICGADTFARRKPDPAHLLGTITAAGGTPATAVMVGDTWTDIEAAAAAGVPSILVDFGYGPDDETRRRADRVIESYAELDVRLVKSLIRNSDGVEGMVGATGIEPVTPSV